MAYCQTTDLLIDPTFRLPAGVDKQAYVNMAADEMDSMFGRIYQVPIVWAGAAAQIKYQATIKLLKILNAKLATGRIVLVIALTSESQSTHAYGQSLINEVMDVIKQIIANEIILEGAPVAQRDDESDSLHAPRGQVFNLDPVSAVESFYDFVSNPYPREITGPENLFRPTERRGPNIQYSYSGGSDGSQIVFGAPGTQGPKGDPGEQGLPGPSGDEPQVIVHQQSVPASVWLIFHNMARYPTVDVYVDNQPVDADVVTTMTQVTVTFPEPTVGIAVLT